MRIRKLPILFWCLYFVFCYASDVVLYPESFIIAEILIFATHNLLLFYGLYFFLNRFSTKTSGSTFISLFRLVALLSIFFALRYYLRQIILPEFFRQAYPRMEFKSWVTAGIIWIVNYFFFASAYYYFISSNQKQRKLNLLREKELQSDKEKLSLENALLKAQVSPHFLYNTLNFLYAKALPLSDALSDGILKLSEIMRNTLTPQQSNGLVPLVDEITHIEDVIGLARLRFGSKLNLTFTAAGDYQGIEVPPLSFVTLAENVLKHGDLSDGVTPAAVSFEMNGNALTFKTWNRKRKVPAEISKSIGLSNSLQRLTDAFGDCCLAEIENKDNQFGLTVSVTFRRAFTTIP